MGGAGADEEGAGRIAVITLLGIYILSMHGSLSPP